MSWVPVLKMRQWQSCAMLGNMLNLLMPSDNESRCARTVKIAWPNTRTIENNNKKIITMKVQISSSISIFCRCTGSKLKTRMKIKFMKISCKKHFANHVKTLNILVRLLLTALSSSTSNNWKDMFVPRKHQHQAPIMKAMFNFVKTEVNRK